MKERKKEREREREREGDRETERPAVFRERLRLSLPTAIIGLIEYVWYKATDDSVLPQSHHDIVTDVICG